MEKKRNVIPGFIMEDIPNTAHYQAMTPENAVTEPITAVDTEQIADTDIAAQADIMTPPQIAPLGADMLYNKPEPAERNSFRYLLKDVLSVIISAVIIAAVLKTFVVDSRSVPTGSMIPTIHEGDRVIILKLPYFLEKTPVRFLGNTPARQDVVVFAAPEEFGTKEDLLKRVIGLPGDTVEIKNGLVYVNGVALDEPYVAEPRERDFEAVPVPEDCYFLLGDNRNHSRDSSMWNDPFIPFSKMKGKVLLCYWPISNWGIIE